MTLSEYIITTLFLMLQSVIFFAFAAFLHYVTTWLGLAFPPKQKEERLFFDFGDGERELISGRWIKIKR